MRDELAILRAFVAAKCSSPRRFLSTDAPLCDAAEFNRNFERYNILGVSLEEARRLAQSELAGEPSPHPGISFGLSTGTTGKPGVFMTSAAERAQWAGTMLARFLSWRQLAGVDVALVLKHNNRLYTDSAKSRRVRLSYFNSQQPVEQWIDSLCGLAPGVLIGPPSLLRAIAFTQRFERKPFRPQTVIAGAEPLFPQDRLLLEERYGVAPRIIYQAREGFLGFGCEHGRVHLNEDLMKFELEPIRGHPERVVPIITDFTRTTQTYTRYRMDDVLITASAPCPCGSRFRAVSAVEGRLQDVFVRPDGRYVFPLELNAVMTRRLEPANQFIVEQLDMDSFTVAIEHPTNQSQLLQDLAEALGGQPRLEKIPYRSLMPGEKQRRFRRNCPDR